ncbi:hypothetical protein G6F46_002310 [Rhizopus delemar]|uniref:Uncharacterized protein n=2 Tax=Rhizopus TaxID=4842 RepID=A0A9P6Z084_9FUNG|nr:hypothetical protein G6F55_006516 [Rhizopus delemar]KAG1541346.1 hypothetical protein G6F51_007957 [Rhizopus arrhizus]KAG1503343.1 hypothetical protein G6F54_001749 [Rhizopus delemar]KAG1509427.1 hypothetical protein G6F53_007458 [Rhizopus delemar]KAG1509804.1 hypothetical protein G6F52_011056 [Rhizopus delemar]
MHFNRAANRVRWNCWVCSYGKLLQQRQYIELSDELCRLANHDWRYHPQIKYFVAQLFAGAILFNTDNHQAVILNAIEAYGRKKTVVIHREQFGVKKGTAIDTSLPPAFKTRYTDVWPTTLNTSDGKKLVIGTQSCNLLVTSSLRLDKEDKPCLGATTMNFDLCGKVESLTCAIYLDSESVTRSLALGNDPTARCISNIDYVYQMRQLNSKYNDTTTYFLTRCSSHFARSHATQPYTMFTLADCNSTRSPGATLFNTISCDVLESDNSAKLDKELIFELQAASTGRMKEIMDSIAIMFDKKQHIPIMKNTKFSKHLENLAVLLHPYLANANKSTQTAILQQFCCTE